MSEPISSAAPDPPSRRRHALQERVADAIVDAAATVIATRGPSWSMADIANAAGVARGTLYRYFPTRELLLTRVADVALADAAARLSDAQLDRVVVREGVVRVVRALLDLGDFFGVLAGENAGRRHPGYEATIGDRIRILISRGQDDGEFRRDLPAESLAGALVALVSAMWGSTMGRDDTVAACSDLFLRGATATPAAAAVLKEER